MTERPQHPGSVRPGFAPLHHHSAPRRRSAALLVVVLIGSLLALLPGDAGAEHGFNDSTGPQIDVTPDGYNTGGRFGAPQAATVTGKGFTGPDVAQIFQCLKGAVDLRRECQPLATAPIDLSGAFGPTGVLLTQTVASSENPELSTASYCRGGSLNNSQCSVVAATYAPGGDQITSKAEHLICYEGRNPNVCEPRSTADTTTTTTTTTVEPTTTTTEPTTATTTLPEPQPQCELREHVVKTLRKDRPQDDPAVFEGQTESSGDLQWVQRPQLGATPPARQGHAMAYLPPAPGRPGQTVMFGGFQSAPTDGDPGGCVLGDTWIWDGSAWARAATPGGGPPARYGHAMAYDGVGIVLFGGYDGSVDLGDTWTWDGQKWTLAVPKDKAPELLFARSRTAMAYNAADPDDPGDDHAVLFGGSRIVKGAGEVLGDTWSWHSSTKKWTAHEPVFSPQPRAYHHMAYRPGSGVVVHGGWNGRWTFPTDPSLFEDGNLAGTFTWDGAGWTIKSRGPTTNSGAMAYRPTSDLVVLRAGYSEGRFANGVWDGTHWLDPTRTGPGDGTTDTYTEVIPPRNFPAMAEDASGNLVFFGGYGEPGDVDHLSNPNQTPNPFQPLNPLPTSNDEQADTWTLVTPGRAEVPETNERVTIKVDPVEIAADGISTTEVTVTATFAGTPQEGYEILLSTDGDVTFADKRGITNSEGEYKTLIKASTTPGPEKITATYERPTRLEVVDRVGVDDPAGATGHGVDPLPPPEPVSTVLSERGMTLTLEPLAIPADGASTSVATAKVYKRGLVDEKVCFATDGDVRFSGPEGCNNKAASSFTATRSAPNTWTITITASKTAGPELITATGMVSGLSASAELFEGGAAWVDRTADGPNPVPGRENASMAYDEADKVTVLFGGYYGDHHRTSNTPQTQSETDQYLWYCPCPPDPPEAVGDTWIWDGSAWSQVVNPNWVLNELEKGKWEWKQVATPDRPLVESPTPREGAAMAYDASSGQLVLFGGHDGNGYMDDTWTFDPHRDPESGKWSGTWTKRDVRGPSPRYVANMASDGIGVVLFAGTDGYAYDKEGPADPGDPGLLKDTWRWRNGAWTEVTPKPAAPPPASLSQAPTFRNEEPIVVPLPPPPPGCPAPSGCPPDTATPYPSTIAVSGLTGTVAKVSLTLHGLSWPQGARGGTNGPGDADIMVVAPGGQSVMLMSDACGSEDTNPNPIPKDKPITLSFGDSAAGGLSANGPCTTSGTYRPTNHAPPSGTECSPVHVSDRFPSPAPSRASGASLSQLNWAEPNGTWSLYVVDDCPNDPDPADEAGRIAGGWSLDITTTDAPVNPLMPVSSPPGRGRAAVAYHPPTGKVVMYGGTQEFKPNYGGVQRPYATTNGEPFRPLGDTWLWDPNASTWTQHGVGIHPGERRSAVMAYHQRTGQLMMFGGVGSVHGRVADPNAYPQCPQPFFLANYGCPSDHELSWLNDTWTWDGEGWARQFALVHPPGAFLAGMAPDADGRLVLLGGLGPKSTTNRCRPDYMVGCAPPPERSGPTTWTWDTPLTLRLSARAVPADGSSTSVATAKVSDANGKGIAGLMGSFRSDGDVGISAVTDHGDGTYSATVTASRSGGAEMLTFRTPLGTASASLYEVAPASGPCEVEGEPGTWSSITDMLAPRVDLAAAAATGGDGRIYIFGGWAGGGQSGSTSFSTVHAYDPCAKSWQVLPPMPGGARSLAGAASGPDGRIYVVGGKRYDTVAMDLVEVYTPGRNSTPGRWQTLDALPLTKAGAAVAVDQSGNLYATGGHYYKDSLAHHQNTVDLYSPSSGVWTRTHSLLKERTNHGATLGPGGRIFALGADNGRSVEAHTPGSIEGWKEVMSMSQPRHAFGVSTGPDSLIYAPGGSSGAAVNAAIIGVGASEVFETVEAYAACVDKWLPAPPMSYRRFMHAVVTGPDARIYALGGKTQSAVNKDPLSAEEELLSPEADTVGEAYTIDPNTSPCPKVSVQGTEVQESRSGTAKIKFTISLDRPMTERLVVDYKTKDRTAEAGSDYVASWGSVAFEPLETRTQDVYVTVNADAVAEETEKFELVLSTSTQPSLVSFANNPGVGTILDAGVEGDPVPPTLAIAGDTVYESFVNPMTGHFTVTMSEALSRPVTFEYTTADGTAIAASDYKEKRGQETIKAGETSVNIPFTVLPDEIKEQPERFSMTISNAVGATIAVPLAESTILDAVEGLRIEGPQVWEGNSQVIPALFKVSLGRPLGHPVSVDYATSDDSALAWKDYNPIQGTVHFAPGEFEKIVPVGVLGDHVPEPTEHYTVRLSEPVGEKIGNGTGTGTILDDDGPITAVEPVPPPPALAVVAPPPPPPPAPIAQAQPQAQSQAQQQMQQQAQQQSQSQGQSQAQSQAQSQSQSQSQAQSQGQSQTQGQTQAQSQGQAQAGLADERQRERQVEQARISGRDTASGTEHLATGVRQSSPVGPAALWGGLVVVGLAVAFSQQSKAPTPARQGTPGPRPGTGAGNRLSTERIRGRNRRR